MRESSPDAKAIFLTALEKPLPERAAYLNTACGKDGDLRGRVERLLAANPQVGRSPESDGARPSAETASYQSAGEPGGVIAERYKLLEPIGEGGMGAVWMAQQTEPIKRLVAIKVIKAGMDSEAVLNRFEAERQALAMMDHPNIAKVLDAGTTSAGRPFFAMELVKGVLITRYCDDHKLTPRERLELFVPVCHAVQHAHQKGVIHRDLKPSNVLVAQYDGRAVPKVIDFGVAKATGQPLTDKTLVTGFGAMVGTPEYMSPEQAELNHLDIDTRSDVYSLGVLLYELLTGSTPFSRKEVEQAGALEMLRVIREQEPPLPSVKLSTTDALPTIAAKRSSAPETLAGLLRNELDWLVMKALDKDRNRRYETAASFAADVQRYLAGEAIQAHPPSQAYRLRKFARKNRAALMTAASIVLLLVAGVTVSTWQAVRATRAESAANIALIDKELARAAEAEQRQRAERGEQRAKQGEADAKAVLRFLENQVFAAARPEGQDGGLGRQITLQQAISAALPHVNQSFKDQPLIEAQLRMTLGKSFLCLGQPNVAAEQYDHARTLLTRERGPDHADTLRSIAGLATSYNDLARYADALKLFVDVLERQKATLGSDHPDTLLTMNGLAFAFEKQGLLAKCLKLREEALVLQRATLGLDHPDTLQTMNSLGASYYAAGRNAEAAAMLGQTLTYRRNRLGDDHPDTLVTMSNLANCYNAQGEYAQAIKLMKQTLAAQISRLGPDHPRTLASMNNLAWFLATVADQNLRDPTAALPLAVAVVEALPTNADCLGTLGVVRFRAGDCEGAIVDLERAIGLRNANNPVSSADAFFLTMAHWQLGQKDKARAWYDKAILWMANGLSDNAELKRFRAEAAELLGVEED